MKRLISTYGFILMAVLFTATRAFSQQTTSSPAVISYQGMFTSSDGAPVPDGEYQITVTLYGDEQGTYRIWQDNYRTMVQGGVFSLYLGSGRVPLPGPGQMDKALWIGTQLGEGRELRPLTRIGAAPYAFNVSDRAITTNKLAEGAVTKDKVRMNYVEGISINGRRIEGNGTMLNIQAGKDMDISYDEHTQSVVIGAATSQDETADPTGKDQGRKLQGTALDAWTMRGEGISVSGGVAVPATAGDYIGTNAPGNVIFNIRANGQPAMTFQPNGVTTPSIIGGNGSNGAPGNGQGNVISGGGSGTAATANTIQGLLYNAIGGGEGNKLQNSGSDYNTIGGGRTNSIGTALIATDNAVIGGGFGNQVLGTSSTVGGGRSNFINSNGTGSTVAGGELNNISGIYSTAGGGLANQINGASNTIAGGESNIIDGDRNAIGGGRKNQVGVGTGNGIFSGEANYVDKGYNVIAGGSDNRIIAGDGSFIGGGTRNFVTSSFYSAIAGGSDNQINRGSSSGILSGSQNYIERDNSAIATGVGNRIIGMFGLIGSGDNNSIEQEYDVIGGGRGNNISGSFNFIGNGISNVVKTDESAIVNGNGNQVHGRFSIIGNGENNATNTDYSAIGSGSSNIIDGPFSFIGSGEANTISANHSVIGGGIRNVTQSSSSTIGGGQGNSASAFASTIAGGLSNVVHPLASYSTVGGGIGNSISNGGIAGTIPGGDNLVVQSYGQTAVGVWNAPRGSVPYRYGGQPRSNDPIFMVGNGIAPGHSNAFEVSYNGHSTVTHTNGQGTAVITGSTYTDNIVYAWGDIGWNGAVLVRNGDFGISGITRIGAGWYRITMTATTPTGTPVNLSAASITANISTNAPPGGMFAKCEHLTVSRVGAGVFDIFITEQRFNAGTMTLNCVNIDDSFMFTVTGRP